MRKTGLVKSAVWARWSAGRRLARGPAQVMALLAWARFWQELEPARDLFAVAEHSGSRRPPGLARPRHQTPEEPIRLACSAGNGHACRAVRSQHPSCGHKTDRERSRWGMTSVVQMGAGDWGRADRFSSSARHSRDCLHRHLIAGDCPCQHQTARREASPDSRGIKPISRRMGDGSRREKTFLKHISKTTTDSGERRDGERILPPRGRESCIHPSQTPRGQNAYRTCKRSSAYLRE